MKVYRDNDGDVWIGGSSGAMVISEDNIIPFVQISHANQEQYQLVELVTLKEADAKAVAELRGAIAKLETDNARLTRERDEALRKHLEWEFKWWAGDETKTRSQIADELYGPGTGARLFPEPAVAIIPDRSGNKADLTQHSNPSDNPKPLWWPDDG
jgi:hypothetical protein